MKQFSLIALCSIFLSNCTEKKAEKIPVRPEITVENNDTIGGKVPIPSIKIDSIIEPYTTSKVPRIEILEFVEEIEGMNWFADTLRLRKIGIYQDLDRNKIAYFNDRPFYPINFENSMLNKTFQGDMLKRHFDSLDIKLFKGAESIWGYYYRDKIATDLISDGVIEQWEFKNEVNAAKALQQILRPGGIVYFNTNPYFCRIENSLFVFRTRAMAFSFDQEPLFKKFVKDKGAKTATRDQVVINRSPQKNSKHNFHHATNP